MWNLIPRSCRGKPAGQAGGRIYFIGGASASGKSATATELATEYDLAVVRLDDYHNIIRERELTGEALDGATREIAKGIVGEMIAVRAQCVVEGVWIDPNHAAFLRTTTAFHPIYLGYPNAEPQQRLEQILTDRRNGDGHWLTRRSTSEAVTYLTTGVARSRDLQRHCETLKLDFFDFSDFERGLALVKRHFAAIWNGGRTRHT